MNNWLSLTDSEYKQLASIFGGVFVKKNHKGYVVRYIRIDKCQHKQELTR